jgi:hypothetical protein
MMWTWWVSRPRSAPVRRSAPNVQPTETIVIVPVVPIDEVYGAVKPAVGGSGMLPCMVRVKLWSPEILRVLPSRL